MRTKGLLALLLGSILVACCSCESNEAATAPSEDSPKVVAADSSQAPAADSSKPVAAAAPQAPPKADKPKKSDGGVYNRYNLHYYNLRGLNHASYANYTDCPGHGMLPYNTNFKVGSWRNGFSLKVVDTGMEILFEYKPQNMAGMSAKAYLDTIMSPTPVAYDGLSDRDLEGIKTGTAIVGMTKEGVKVALGYPAKHMTPSLDANAWVYWKGRYNTLRVNFGQDGKVESTR